jgi:hypothetical protein
MGNQNRISKRNRQNNGQKETVQKDKQLSIKHTHKTTDRVTRTPLKTGSEPRCSGMVGSSCSTSDTRRVNLVTKPVSITFYFPIAVRHDNYLLVLSELRCSGIEMES